MNEELCQTCGFEKTNALHLPQKDCKGCRRPEDHHEYNAPWKNLVICVRRWFHKRAGNTYHSVVVYFPDGTTKIARMTYGYGTAYEQTALELIAGKRPDDNRPAWQWYQNNHILVSYDVVDVMRKRDLHGGGSTWKR